MNNYIALLFSLLLFSKGYSQDKSEAKRMFYEAESYILFEEYEEALPLLEKLHELDPVNYNYVYRLGICNLYIRGNLKKSIGYLELAKEYINPHYKEGAFKERGASSEVFYYLGYAYRLNYEFQKAIKYFNHFKEIHPEERYFIEVIDNEIKACQIANELIQSPAFCHLYHLNGAVNSRFPDINPVVSGDEKILAYTSKRSFYDAVLISYKKNGEWSDPMDLTQVLGTDGDITTSFLSYDGKKLLLYKRDEYDGNIYESNYVDTAWTPIKKLNENINTKYWESHASISKDGKTLYFTSNRKGGIGELDIYKSERDSSGDWGVPVNLGPVINTPYNENTPFISENGKILYFSSLGHKTMGGYDIFYAELQEDGQWSEPQNIGYPINTLDNDIFFMPLKNGTYGYYAVYSEEGKGQEDLYKVEIFSDKNPFRYVVKGNINIDPELANHFSVMAIDADKSDTLQKISPNRDGTYNLSLVAGNYTFLFHGDGYQSQSKNLYIADRPEPKEYILNVEMQPEKKEYQVIKNIFFDFDSYIIKKEYQENLDHLSILMKDFPGLEIELEGHADAKGPDTYNLDLSRKRVEIIQQYLINSGIENNRIILKAMGEKSPIAINHYANGNDSPEGRRYNRRTEIHILRSENAYITIEKIEIPVTLRMK